METSTYTAFANDHRIGSGDVVSLLPVLQAYEAEHPNVTVLVFCDRSGRQTELSELSGQSLPVKGRGRPRLGVVSREISLLPRHWEWLGIQKGGASATLRRLIEEASQKTRSQDEKRLAQDAIYHFVTVMAGNLEHFEEALRALYKSDQKLFATLSREWPEDVKSHLNLWFKPAFA